MDAKKVFISYSHDSKEHAARVAGLAASLRRDGLDCRIDQYVEGSPPEGWPRWMEKTIEWAEFVLVVCTKTYFRRVRKEEPPGKGLGATWEAHLIYQHLYEAHLFNAKFVPVIFDSTNKDFIPTPLRGVSHYVLDGQMGYDRLYVVLTGQHKPPPDLGAVKTVAHESQTPLFGEPGLGVTAEVTEEDAEVRRKVSSPPQQDRTDQELDTPPSAPGRATAERPPAFPPWAPTAGMVFGGLTLVFFMALVFAAVLDKPVPDPARFLVVAVLSLGVALSFAFIGGDAAAKGQLPLPGIEEHAATFSVAGGIGVFVIVLLIASTLYGPAETPTRVKVPSVTGLLREAAAEVLKKNSLILGKISQRPSKQPAETVLDQSPSAGAEVEQGSSADLVVASAPCNPAPDSGFELLSLTGGKGEVLDSGPLGPFCEDVTLKASATATGHQTDRGKASIRIDIAANKKHCKSDRDVTDNNSFRTLTATCENHVPKGETASFSLTPIDSLAGIDNTTLTITVK